MALLDILSSSINIYDDTDPVWRQFIADHKQYLIDRSNTVFISPSYIQGYVYSLPRYLKSIAYNIHCTWIIRLINNIPTDIDFNTSVSSLMIPPFTVIQGLYTTYSVQRSISA